MYAIRSYYEQIGLDPAEGGIFLRPRDNKHAVRLPDTAPGPGAVGILRLIHRNNFV